MSYTIEIMQSTQVEVAYLEVDAGVRYWEDATVNGEVDTEGTLIPFGTGDAWVPVIDLKTGNIQGWPAGTTADIHYKVCDAGEYWLLDANKKRVAKWSGHYVPDHFLSIGQNGYGDYIIMTVCDDGHIQDWPVPSFSDDEWEAVA